MSKLKSKHLSEEKGIVDLSSHITALIKESYALERSGNIGEAYQQATAALHAARQSGDSPATTEALTCLAHILYHMGHYDEARSKAQEAWAHAGSETHARANALRLLGDCAHEAGDLTTAEQCYRRAIDLGRKLGDTYILHRCLHSLAACVYIPRGQFDLALASDEESLHLALELKISDEVWLPLATLGWVYWVTGQPQKARAVTEEMRRVVQPGSLAEGYWYCLRADLAQQSATPASALPLYAQARTIAEAVGDPGLNAELRVGLSRYYRNAGNASTAYEWANDALNIAVRAGSLDVQGWALVERGRDVWELGDYTAAKADFRTAIELLEPVQAHFDLARAHFLLAALLHQQADAKASAAWLEAVSRIVSGGYAFLLDQERAVAYPLLAHYLNSADSPIAAVSATLLGHLEHVPPPALAIQTLGQFQVRQGTRTIPAEAWKRRRSGELFRLLLISPSHTRFRDQVAEVLWPESSPASTSAGFYQATSALRHALEPDLPDKFPSRYLTVEEGKITLRLPPGSWIDFEAFERHIKDEAWEAALAQYTGPLFPEDRYADWAAMRRERLSRNYIRAALAAAQQWLEAGRYDDVLEACHRILALEPWQEEAVLLGMQANVALHNRAGALRLYLDLERKLRDDLDIAPQAKIHRYYQSLCHD